METDELKNLWQQEKASLQKRIKLNEKAIKNMSLDKSLNTFKALRNFSALGRNLALVYFIISMVVAYNVIEDFYYSIPIIIGGLLMLWSFIHHLSIEKPKKYHSQSVIDLQKSIEKFRIHSMKSQRFDMLVVLIWMLTLAPVYFKNSFNLDIYASREDILQAGLIFFVVIAIMFVITKIIYREYDKKLRDSENRLSEITDFEKE